FGVTDTAELSLAWTPFQQVLSRNRAAGTRTRSRGAGDLVIAFKQNLARPDGGGFAFALAPLVSLPVGSGGTGAGDWGAGVAIPISYALGERVSLQWTQSFEAAVDGDGEGRHFAATSVLGIGVALSAALGAGAELSASRDEDPAGVETQRLASVYVAWMPSDDWQLDLGSAAGLNGASPDFRLYAGIS